MSIVWASSISSTTTDKIRRLIPDCQLEPAPHVIREFIQHLATPEALAHETLRLLNDPAARANLVSSVNDIVSTLDADGAALRASQAILATL